MYVRTGTGSSPSSFGKRSIRLNSDLSDYVITRSGSVSGITINANSNTAQNIPITIPSGYKMLGVSHFGASDFVVNIANVELGSDFVRLSVRNMYSSAVTVSLYATAILVRNI